MRGLSRSASGPFLLLSSLLALLSAYTQQSPNLLSRIFLYTEVNVHDTIVSNKHCKNLSKANPHMHDGQLTRRITYVLAAWHII